MASVDMEDVYTQVVGRVEVVNCNPAMVEKVIGDYPSSPVDIESISMSMRTSVALKVTAQVNEDETNGVAEATDRVVKFYRWLQGRMEALDQLATDMRLLREIQGGE